MIGKDYNLDTTAVNPLTTAALPVKMNMVHKIILGGVPPARQSLTA